MRNRLRENVKYFVQNLNKIKDWCGWISCAICLELKSRLVSDSILGILLFEAKINLVFDKNSLLIFCTVLNETLHAHASVEE